MQAKNQHCTTTLEPPKDIDISLKEFFFYLIAHWKLMVPAAIISFCFSLTLSLFLPDTYRSTALLEPSDELQGGGLSAVASQLGGIASLAGIDISNNKSKVYAAIEALKSRVFIYNFIETNDLLVPLFAIKSWDANSNKL